MTSSIGNDGHFAILSAALLLCCPTPQTPGHTRAKHCGPTGGCGRRILVGRGPEHLKLRTAACPPAGPFGGGSVFGGPRSVREMGSHRSLERHHLLPVRGSVVVTSDVETWTPATAGISALTGRQAGGGPHLTPTRCGSPSPLEGTS
jgi:hypothetical protein